MIVEFENVCAEEGREVGYENVGVDDGSDDGTEIVAWKICPSSSLSIWSSSSDVAGVLVPCPRAGDESRESLGRKMSSSSSTLLGAYSMLRRKPFSHTHFQELATPFAASIASSPFWSGGRFGCRAASLPKPYQSKASFQTRWKSTAGFAASSS